MPNKNTPISAIILSGGQGRRMDYQDKGLILFENKNLIEHVVEKVSPQVSEIIISCNRNIERYSQLGYPCVTDHSATDHSPDFLGPLAGILSAQSKVSNPLCFIAPCDVLNIPINIVAKLVSEIDDHQAAVASIAGRIEPLLSVIKTQDIVLIEKYLNSGKRSVIGWLKSLNLRIVEFSGESDCASNDANANEKNDKKVILKNINTPTDLF